jgi:hypothetical protein
MANPFEKRPTTEVIELSSNPSTSSATTSPSTGRLLWKLDLRILPLLYLAYIITFIDRANIGNVKIEGMLTDLGMGGNDYNVALVVYAVPFILLELPSSLALRRVRPAWWISGTIFGWGEYFLRRNGGEWLIGSRFGYNWRRGCAILFWTTGL